MHATKDFPAEPRAAVEQALENALASIAAAEEVLLDDLSCVRDYSVACPSGAIDNKFIHRRNWGEIGLPAGWVDVGDGLTCLVSCVETHKSHTKHSDCMQGSFKLQRYRCSWEALTLRIYYDFQDHVHLKLYMVAINIAKCSRYIASMRHYAARQDDAEREKFDCA